MGLLRLAHGLTAVLCVTSLLFACSDDPEGVTPTEDTAVADPGVADMGAPDVGVSDPGANLDEGPAPDLGTDTGPPAPTIPDTPAGAKLQWALDLVNNRAGLLTAADLQANFSPIVLRDAPAQALKFVVAGWAQQLAPLEFMGLEPGASDTALLARVRARDGRWFHLWTVVEADGAHRVDVLWLRTAPLLDPTLAPPGADEIVIELFNPYGWGSIAGATVELVDAATGQSFNPPITGTPEAQYSCVALTPPSAGGNFGIRATLPDGFVTTTYASGPFAARAPGMALSAPAFPAAALDAYLAELGAAADPTKGHVWGPVNHQPRSDPTASLHDWRIDVGCAQVSLGGAGTVVYGAATSEGRPDATRDDTDRRGSTWWAFNVEPAALTVTVAAGAASVATALPAPRAGEMTVVISEFSRSDYPTNPQPAGCQVQPMHGAWRSVGDAAGDACMPSERSVFIVRPSDPATLQLGGGAQQYSFSCDLDAHGALLCPKINLTGGLPQLDGLASSARDLSGAFADDLHATFDWSSDTSCTAAACDDYASANGIAFPCHTERTYTMEYFEPPLDPVAELGCDQEGVVSWTEATAEVALTVRQSATEERLVYRVLADGSRFGPTVTLVPGVGDLQINAWASQPLIVTNAAGECQTLFDVTADGLLEVK